MALFPCDLHQGRYRGTQSSAYPALLNGANSRRRKIRSCKDCLEHLVEDPIVPLVELLPDMETMPGSDGHGCAKHPNLASTQAFFLTLYLRDEDRERSFYAPVCDGCADDLAKEWLLNDG